MTACYGNGQSFTDLKVSYLTLEANCSIH